MSHLEKTFIITEKQLERLLRISIRVQTCGLPKESKISLSDKVKQLEIYEGFTRDEGATAAKILNDVKECPAK